MPPFLQVYALESSKFNCLSKLLTDTSNFTFPRFYNHQLSPYNFFDEKQLSCGKNTRAECNKYRKTAFRLNIIFL